ncbi:cytochrome C oxidase subunit II [Candidatus Woesearchaeota archaeon CG10_big_fil_rev_8_21_14_0_10_44_13]|nr:MAG: cytochrome C oxidase subunit II [Candidatus Woesearchaeota archaeon CG10_big_fil_rev_8_21_14_0_10_44_13]
MDLSFIRFIKPPQGDKWLRFNMKKMILILVVLLLAGCAKNASTGQAVTDVDGVKEYDVDAFRFSYTPDEIRVKQGDDVRININNVDTPHGIMIPDFNAEGENTVEFTADKKGEFAWYCLIPCGSGHMQMRGKIIVE